MENEKSSMREGFDRIFIGQNPTDSFVPPSLTAGAGQDRRHQQPSLMGSSSSMRSLNGKINNNGFLVDNGVFPFLNKQQQLSAMGIGAHLGVNRVRSIHEYDDRYAAFLPDNGDFNPFGYCCNSCNPDQFYCGIGHRSSFNGFQETLNDRNLEIRFNRLNISSPRNNLFVDSYMGNIYPEGRIPAAQNTGCNDICCDDPSFLDYSPEYSRGYCNVLDQNPIRSRDWVRDYPNHISSPILQSRQQQPKRNKFSASLKDIRGKICGVAKDQEGCQFLQTKCEEGKPEEIEMIFNEIKDHIPELMTDASMNYLAQKFFRVCNERQMTYILASVIADDNTLTNICLNSHGTRAMQKLIELLTTSEQRSMMVSALRRITVTLTKNTNGHHVIQHCLKSFFVDEVQPILNVVAANCLAIATDKSGCCVLQECVLHATGASKERLITEIIENALHLAEHPYGNYVVQHILGMQIPEVTHEVLQRLVGNFVYLATNKYASNVVEKCLKDAPEDQSIIIIREIINSPKFLSLIQHPFGNYVAQSALQIAKGSLKEMMINKVQKEYAFLHSHPHGKRVLAMARNSKPRG